MNSLGSRLNSQYALDIGRTLNVTGIHRGGRLLCKSARTNWSSHDPNTDACMDSSSGRQIIYYGYRSDSGSYHTGPVGISYGGTQTNFRQNAGLELSHYKKEGGLAGDSAITFTLVDGIVTTNYTLGVDVDYDNKFVLVAGNELAGDSLQVPLFTITPSRNFGVGIVSPNAQFHVHSSSNIGFLITDSGESSDILSVSGVPGGKSYFIFNHVI